MHAIKVRSISLCEKGIRSRKRRIEEIVCWKLTKNWHYNGTTTKRFYTHSHTFFSGIYFILHIVQRLIYFRLSIYFGDDGDAVYSMFVYTVKPIRVIGIKWVRCRCVMCRTNPYPFNICFIHFLNSCSSLILTYNVTHKQNSVFQWFVASKRKITLNAF